MWPLSISIFVCFLLALPAGAVSRIQVVTVHTKVLPKGINESHFVVGFSGSGPSSASRHLGAAVSVTAVWSNSSGKPEIFTNSDHSLIAIQTAPYWWKTGRVRFGRRISLLVSMPNHKIKLIKDFSAQLNRLRLANVSRWDHLAGHYYRPASTIFLVPLSMNGREIYANQYAIDPKVGLPEYNTLDVRVDAEGKLSFLAFTSQGF